MITTTDQIGCTVTLPRFPKRIISLVPSQTELLFHLGLDEAVTGITKFCIHPDHWFRNKTRVGGTKNIDIEKIKVLNPDLIIANKEENVKEQVNALRDIAPVWTSDVNDLTGALDMIHAVGELTGTAQKATQLAEQIRKSFEELPVYKKIPAVYLIWNDPYMTVGGDTFISDMMQRAGINNVFAHLNRYPEISLKEISESSCNLVLLSSEPYPFKQKHADELATKLPGKKIMLVDGEMFSWYGSRLQHTAAYLKKIVAD